MTDWLYPANIKYYDVLSALEENEAVWPINSKVEVGDTVYFYLASPYKRIGYICTVTETDVSSDIVSKYSKPYIKRIEPTKPSVKRFMLFTDITKLLDSDDESLTLASLKLNGLKGMLMGPRKLDNNPQLHEYIRNSCIC